MIGSTFIEFDDVKVPVENLLGQRKRRIQNRNVKFQSRKTYG